MTAVLASRAAVRRYVVLTVLRWLPTGIALPVMALLAASRGLAPADVGVLFALYSAVALVLELPTGGLADVLGPRPVLAAAAVLQGAGLLVFAGAGSLPGLAVAVVLLGAARSLDSGPLESWYVDTLAAAEPAADPAPGLASASAANGAGLAVGAVLGGVLPAVAARWGTDDVLALPFLVGAGLVAVHLGAVLVLVTPLPVVAPRTAGPTAAPGVVRATVAWAARDRTLRLTAVITGLTGVVLATLESVGPPRFGELAGSPAAGTATFGVVMAVSFAAASAGAALSPLAGRLARGSVAAASAALWGVCALAVVVLGSAGGVVLAGVACAVFYLANAAGWPLRQALLHTRVGAGQRTTTVSVMSFAAMTGGIVGSLVMPRLAEVAGLGGGLALTAVPLLAAAALSLRLPDRTGPVAPDVVVRAETADLR